MKDRLRRWAMDSPVNLAIFRVVVGVVLLRLPDLGAAVHWASMSDRLRTPPVGLEWALGVVPMGVEVARPLYWIVVAATVLGVVGLATRVAWTVVALGSLWLLAIPQFAGSVFHYHHLVWFAMLLAASPCGDALSIDARIARWRGKAPPSGAVPSSSGSMARADLTRSEGRGARPRARRRAPANTERSLAYGVPIRAAWLLVALIFFFPGLHKLLESGWEWIWSDNLQNQMYAKWLQMPEFTPLFRVDRYPTLVRLGALSAVAFELSFVGLVLFRRTRLVAVAIALAFHQATAELMGIRFPALWLCYVVFVDWEALYRRARRLAPAEPPAASERWPRVSMIVAGVLLAGNLAYGAAGISDGWPFACYPKFHRTVQARLPALRVEVVAADGAVREVPVDAMSPGGPTQRWWAITWSVMGAHERARAEPARWSAFWRSIARRPAVEALARDAVAVRFSRDMISTVPEDADDPPLSTRVLYELPLR